MSIAERSATMRIGGARSAGPLSRTVVIVAAIAILTGVIVGRFVYLGSGRDQTATASPLRGGSDLRAASDALTADPDNPVLLAAVGAAALSEARRTGDPTLYARAEESATRAVEAAPGDMQTLVPAALVALARHDFAGALRLAERAREAAPLAVAPLGPLVDALVELGRYDEAALHANEMVSRRPNLSSLPRLSYVLELRGDPEGALEVMQQAVAAGGARGPDGAYVVALLGDLHLQAGRLDAAERSYRRALVADDAQPQARIGIARVLIARGDLVEASEQLERLIDRVPLAEAVALHADVLHARGADVEAAEQRAYVRVIEELNRSRGGIDVDLELAQFEADHARLPDGDPARAVELAREARMARPTIYGDDTLAWALRQAGRPAEALSHAVAATRFGTADARLWWHRAAIEWDLARFDDARASLRRALAISPHLPIVDAAEVDRVRTALADNAG